MIKPKRTAYIIKIKPCSPILNLFLFYLKVQIDPQEQVTLKNNPTKFNKRFLRAH